jgi:hypothetical protein
LGNDRPFPSALGVGLGMKLGLRLNPARKAMSFLDNVVSLAKDTNRLAGPQNHPLA